MQFVALTVSVRFGPSAGHFGRWIDALVLRLADIILDLLTLFPQIAVAAPGRGGVVVNGHNPLIGR